MVEGLGGKVDVVDCRRPPGQFLVLGVEDLQVVDVPQQVDPAPLLQPWVMVVGGVEVLTNTPSKESPRASSTTSLFRPRRRKYRSVGVLKVQT